MIGSDLALAVSPPADVCLRDPAPALPGGRDGLRHEAQHRAPPERRRLRRDGLPGRDLRRSGCSPPIPDGIFLSNGPGDPAALAGPVATIEKLLGAAPHLRDLPRAPASRSRPRRLDLQAQVRPPRNQPSGGRPRDGRGGDHVAEPRFRRGPGIPPARSRADAPQLERRHARRIPAPGAAHPGRAIPSRGGARPARRERRSSKGFSKRCAAAPPGSCRRPADAARARSRARLPAFPSVAPDLGRLAPRGLRHRARGRRARRGHGPALRVPRRDPREARRGQRGSRRVPVRRGRHGGDRPPAREAREDGRRARDGARRLSDGPRRFGGGARRRGRRAEGDRPRPGGARVSANRRLRRPAPARRREGGPSQRRRRRGARPAARRLHGRPDRPVGPRRFARRLGVPPADRALPRSGRLSNELRRVRLDVDLPRPGGVARSLAHARCRQRRRSRSRRRFAARGDAGGDPRGGREPVLGGRHALDERGASSPP